MIDVIFFSYQHKWAESGLLSAVFTLPFFNLIEFICGGEASISDTFKFIPVSNERPTTKGRPPKHYHPLLQKEKHLESVVRRILPKQVVDKVCTKGSRLAHLYGLLKTHKPQLAMRPILSAQGTYNYALAKWLDEKLKQLSLNQYTISDIFSFRGPKKYVS